MVQEAAAFGTAYVCFIRPWNSSFWHVAVDMDTYLNVILPSLTCYGYAEDTTKENSIRTSGLLWSDKFSREDAISGSIQPIRSRATIYLCSAVWRICIQV